MLNSDKLCICFSKFSIFKYHEFFWLYIYYKKYNLILKINKKHINLTVTTNWALLNRVRGGLFNLQTAYKIEQLHIYKYHKIKFSGKGYKIKKNTNKSIVMLFNRAHKTLLWWKNVSLKKHKKYKIYISGGGVATHLTKEAVGIRRINIFTKKGLRKSRQIIFKKKGKK